MSKVKQTANSKISRSTNQDLSQKISVIIQGPIDWDPIEPNGFPTTYQNIQQIKKLLPNAEIILSTWQDQKTDFLEVDKVISNPDPGPQIPPIKNGIANNVNRQILSTSNGLKHATREFALKIRSDLTLTSTKFITTFLECPPPSKEFKIFKNKIISNNLSSRKPEAIKGIHLCYHPADHVHFGTREDLITLWDIPLQAEEDAAYFEKMQRPDAYRTLETSRLTPEQYICATAFSKNRTIKINNYADGQDIESSKALLQENFFFLKDAEFSIHFPKYHTSEHKKYEWMRLNSEDN